MFRYIGLFWSPRSEGDSAAAGSLSDELLMQADWAVAWRRPGQHVFVTGTEPRNNQALCLGDDRGVVLGKLFRRQHLANPSSPSLKISDSESAQIARTGGGLLIDEFWGRYVAFIDAGDGRTAVVRDPSGSLPCYAMRHGNVQIVFSWLNDLLSLLPQLPLPAVDWASVAARFAFGELTGRLTALEGITQVLPGERWEIGADTSQRTQLWSALNFASDPLHIDPGPAADTLRATVRGCVQSWASCHEAVLLRLSGGVDSSIVLSCLAEGQTLARVSCVNYHSPGADSDERMYARLAATRARRDLNERARDSGFRLERVLDVARTPTPPSYVGRTSARMDAELAAAIGARAMFTGGGGDQLFFEFSEWWPAADYLRLHGLNAGFPRAAMAAARLGRVSFWRAVALAFADRLRRRSPLLEAHKQWTLVSDFVHQQAAQPARFVHPSLLAPTALPIGKLTQALQLVYPAGYYDPFERDAAPELVNPLLSQPLIELCLRLPTYRLTHGGRGRGLARRAFAADLPPEIVRRSTKGGMENHTRSLLLRQLPFVREMLLDGELVHQGILDRTATENLLAGPPDAVGSRVGELHTCLSVEAWLRRWATSPRPTLA